MYCEKCGEEINDNALFCPYCGYKVGVQPAHGGNILYDFDPSHRYDNSYREDRYREYDPGYVPHYRYKSTAAVLALLFGWFGFHNFYLGYTKKGLIQFILNFFGLGFVSAIWSLFEFINIISGKIAYDGRGYPLQSHKR